MKVEIYTVTHKDYWMPSDPMYVPIQVGFGGDLGFIRDNTLDNISHKNKNYCELTALYWAYKHSDADVIGLDHYRRHFVKKRFGNKKDRVLDSVTLTRFLNKADILLPSKRHYWIETNESQYIHAHHKEDLEFTKQVLLEKYPEMIDVYEREMKKTYGHRFNMCIMKRCYFNEYCAFLFDVLFEVEKRLDISTYSEYDQRVFGFISERLLDVWLYSKGYSYCDIPYSFMENENWIKKIYKFIKRKIKGVVKCE